MIDIRGRIRHAITHLVIAAVVLGIAGAHALLEHNE